MKPIAVMIILLAVAAGPAWGEHRMLGDADGGAPTAADEAVTPFSTGEPSSAGRPRSTDLELELRLGLKGFRLGGRLLGRDGVAGAWLNGGIGANGFALDGRVQRDDGRAWNFKLDAEVLDEAKRLAWRWLRGRVLTTEDGGRI